MQLSCSALTAEALKLCNPASIHSRSTEAHNQDKVSMGTIAARDARTIVEILQHIAAIHLIAIAQALELRGVEQASPKAREAHAHGPRARRRSWTLTGAWTATSTPSSSSSAPASCRGPSWGRRGCAGRPSFARVGPCAPHFLLSSSLLLSLPGAAAPRRSRSAPGTLRALAVDAAGTAYIACNGTESTGPAAALLPAAPRRDRVRCRADADRGAGLHTLAARS